jgi:hypothetical protein
VESSYFNLYAIPLFPLASENQIWGKKHHQLRYRSLESCLKFVLPLKIYDIDGAISLVKWVQRNNYKAYLSHSYRQMASQVIFYNIFNHD